MSEDDLPPELRDHDKRVPAIELPLEMPQELPPPPPPEKDDLASDPFLRRGPES